MWIWNARRNKQVNRGKKRSPKKNRKVWEYFPRGEGGWGETQNRKGLRIKLYPEEAPNRAASLLNYVKCYNK